MSDDEVYDEENDEENDNNERIIATFRDVQRVLPGIPQSDESQYTWCDPIDRRLRRNGHLAFYGTVLLLHMADNSYKCISATHTINFRIPMGETITTFYSFMENNTIPWPGAISERYVYHLDDNSYIERTLLPKKFDLQNTCVRCYDYFDDDHFDQNDPKLMRLEQWQSEANDKLYI
jgi:hypothetical protein